jgi:predicted lysophospholipase L1 biosynthesis ABC-type transport system permease subunit
MVRGRPISAGDVAGSEPVVVITESMSHTFWPGRDPLRECVFAVGDTNTCRRVVGIVRDVRWQLAGAAQPHFYLPLAQFRGDAGRYWLVRTRDRVKPEDAAEIERIARTFDVVSRPGVSVVRELLAPQIKPLRAASTLLLVFGLLALFLAGSGVYGLITSEMSQRTRELGIRMALGAETRDVVRLVLASGTRVLAIGIAAGLVGAVLSGRLIASFLFNTTPYDPFVIGIVIVITTMTSLAAMAVPGIRAARLDPVAALRAE